MISILLPNLNGAPFLEIRFQTILAQTLEDWELIVVDGFSKDGSWEMIEKYAAKDARIRVFQEPPEGIYAAWNSCLEKACGEYLTIATSDDTMDPSFLERMVGLLKAHPECDLAMCGVDFIDATGHSLSAEINWESFPAPQFFGSFFERQHVRKAPLDSILGGALHNIIHSTTQIVVRRSVYDRIGNYRIDLKNIADFEWALRASVVSNVVYTPEKLATWRVHAEQASNDKVAYTARSMDDKLGVLRLAYETLWKFHPDIARRLTLDSYTAPFRFQRLIYRLREERSLFGKLRLILGNLCLSPLEMLWAGIWMARSRGSKEALRRCFAEWLMRKSGVNLGGYLVTER